MANPIDDAVSTDGSDCWAFEQRLNDWADLRQGAAEISHDPHLSRCQDCQTLLGDYLRMLNAAQMLGGQLESGAEENCPVHRPARGSAATEKPLRGRMVGWSTLLAVLFLFLGAPTVPTAPIEGTGWPTEFGSIESASMEYAVGRHAADIPISSVSFGSGLNLELLSEYPGSLANNLVSINPLIRSAPSGCQPFFDLPTGRLLAAGLPTVDLEEMDLKPLNQIGQYWQHASHLPGIEPWQHSVSFAIGWFNQSPSMVESLDQRG